MDSKKNKLAKKFEPHFDLTLFDPKSDKIFYNDFCTTVNFKPFDGVGYTKAFYDEFFSSMSFTSIFKLHLDFGIEKIIFNGPATIVLFKDGTKEVVKLHKGDQYSAETAVLYCLFKHIYGHRLGYLKKLVNKYIEESNKNKTVKKSIKE